MPSTSYNVTMILNAVGNISRPQALDILNEISLIVFSDNTIRVEKIDTATGMPPYLVTIDGTRHYNCPSDCRETAAIFIEDPQRQYTPSQDKGFYTEYIFRGQRYYKVAATQQPALINQLATVTFVDNPGTTTQHFFHHYFIKHTDITDESIQLPFPQEVHYLLRDAALQMVKGENYSAGLGNVSPLEKIKSMIRNKMNKGANARANRTPILEECRDEMFPGWR